MEADRARSEATYHFVVDDFKNMEKPRYSSLFYIQNIPWSIMVQLKNLNHNSYLAVYLHIGKDSPSLPCFVMAELRLISHKLGVQPYCRKIDMLFNCALQSCGFSEFMNWYDIINSQNVYVKDGAITIEAHVIVKPPNALLTVKEKISIEKTETLNTIEGTIKIPYSEMITQNKNQVKYIIYSKNSYDRFELKFLLHLDKNNFDVYILHWKISCDDLKTLHNLECVINGLETPLSILNLRCFQWKRLGSFSSKVKEIKYTFKALTKTLDNGKHVFFTHLKDDLDLKDFTLKNDNKYEVKIHKLVMACQSKVFRTMLKGDWNETKDNVYTIKNITDDTLKQLANYLYTGDVSKENSYELLSFAMMYEIDDLVNKCMLHIYESITCENAVHLLHETLNIYLFKVVRGILYFIKENINEVQVNLEKKSNRKLNSFLENQIKYNVIFAKLRNDVYLTDYVLKNDNNYEVKIHKVVIACQSIVFHEILADKKRENEIIKNMSDGALNDLVDYLYTGDVPEEHPRELLSFAVKYKINDLADICMAHIYKSITCENAVQILHQSLNNNWSQLVLSSLHFIANNLGEVFQNFYVQKDEFED